MKKRSVQLACLAALVLALLIAVRAAASGEPETGVTTCRYYYQLTQGSVDTDLLLTVDRTDPEGRPLFMGYITLAVRNGSLQFVPADPWTLTASPVSGGTASDMDAGTTSDGWNYISFCWQAKDQSKVDASGASQVLGTLTVPRDTTLDDIELLVWPETAAGKHLVSLWEQAKQETDPDPAIISGYLTDIESIWRMPDREVLHQGYYQGYYAPEGPAQTPDPDAGTEPDETTLSPVPEAEQTPSPSDEGQDPVPEDSAADDGAEVFAVDLTAGWQGFQVGAYAPQRPITLTFLDPGTKATVAEATYAMDTGTGHFKARMDFTKLAYTQKPEGAETFIPHGKYDLKISKPSHVTCTIPELEFENGVCVDLLGIYVELPCGDVDGDGFIGQYDRAQLTEPATYRMTYADEAQKDPNKEPCDLDGDHRVDQTDLSILIAPGNYGARDFIRKDVK